MFNLKDLEDAKRKAKEIRKETAGSAYHEAVQLLEEFEESQEEPDKNKLSLAADKLIETIKFDPENVEAYICISYIYYVLGEDENCLKYLDIAEEALEDKLPEDLIFFRNSVKKNMIIEDDDGDFSENSDEDYEED